MPKVKDLSGFPGLGTLGHSPSRALLSKDPALARSPGCLQFIQLFQG